MIQGAIDKILEMARVQQFEIDGRKYTSKSLFPVFKPEPEPLVVSTLTGLVNYIESNVDELHIPDEIIIHVKNPDQVELRSKLEDEFEMRSTYLVAVTAADKYPFAQFMDVESFIIRLQAMFVQDETTKAILKVVGNVENGVIKKFSDDGVTRQATVKTGVSRVVEIPVPNPVEMAPYRTFLEIEQPKSRFVFRMRSGEAPSCALFEADGGAWKNEAILKIREWLKYWVGEIAIIA
jgi:hypothetical protein